MQKTLRGAISGCEVIIKIYPSISLPGIGIAHAIGASCWPPEAGRPAVSFDRYCISHTRAASCLTQTLSEHGDAHAGLLRRGSRDHQPGWVSDVWPGCPRDVRAIWRASADLGRTGRSDGRRT